MPSSISGAFRKKPNVPVDNKPSFLSLLAHQIRSDFWAYTFIFIYTLVGIFYLIYYNSFTPSTLSLYTRKWALLFAILMPLSMLFYDVTRIIIRLDHRRRLAFRLVYPTKRIAHICAGILLLLVMNYFQATFTAIKSALPLSHGGFPYDELHADLDALLHFGHDPWQLIQPFLDSHLARSVIEWNYNTLYFVLTFGILFYVVTAPKAAHLRNRYIICFALVWVLIGNILAGMFLSAGPAYYGYITGDVERFAAQLQFLGNGPLGGSSAAQYQAYLWAIYEQQQLGFGSGISAFPSIHVALTVINALFLIEMNRKLAVPAYAYVVLIMISSVYLAWHYAIDGYASVIVTALIFYGVKEAAKLKTRRRGSTKFQHA